MKRIWSLSPGSMTAERPDTRARTFSTAPGSNPGQTRSYELSGLEPNSERRNFEAQARKKWLVRTTARLVQWILTFLFESCKEIGLLINYLHESLQLVPYSCSYITFKHLAHNELKIAVILDTRKLIEIDWITDNEALPTLSAQVPGIVFCIYEVEQNI